MLRQRVPELGLVKAASIRTNSPISHRTRSKRNKKMSGATNNNNDVVGESKESHEMSEIQLTDGQSALVHDGGEESSGDDEKSVDSCEEGDRAQLLTKVRHKQKVTHRKAAHKSEPLKMGVPEKDESSLTIFSQVVLPFLVAGSGMVGAGYVLDLVQHWPVFERIPEIFILVPALLGLKGNLEMTLASRLSTLANLGRLDRAEDQWRIVISNLALIQAQAAVVAFLASLFAVTLAWVPKGELHWPHAFVLMASSLTTASLASLVLGVIMVLVILASRKYNINPDNVATPIAASLGDLTTLAVLSLFSTIFLNSSVVVNLAVIGVFVLSTPVAMYYASKDDSSAAVLHNGWTPVIMAMLISSAGGFIFKAAVRRYSGIAVFQPVINGVGGNLVAVAASRLSTSLHHSASLGVSAASVCVSCSPVAAFCSQDACSRSARVLLLLVVPGHLVFNTIIYLLEAGHTSITLPFTTVYLTAAFIQVFILLWVCRWLVYGMWSVGVDPDNSAIPYLTALGDLLGTALLAMAFALLDMMALGAP